MDVFNNREIALGIWLLIFMAGAFTYLSVRRSFYSVVKAFTHKAILISVILMAIYIGLLIYGLYKVGVWDWGQLKNTIVWSVSVAAVSLFRIQEVTDDPHYFKKTVKDNLKLLVVLEFIISFYTFDLWVEILVVPLATGLAAMLAVAQSDKKYELVTNLLNGFLALFGGGLFAYAAYKLWTDFSSFTTRQTLTDFSLPPVMLFLYLPFLYMMAFYVDYQNVFFRLSYSIKDPSLKTYAKRRAIRIFHIRTGLLKRWGRNLLTWRTESTEDIENSIREVIMCRARERRPVEVSYHRGWSPYAARDFLTSEGLTTDDYHRNRGDSDEWFASSSYLKFGDGFLPNDISYYIEGNETAVTALKLVMNVNVPDVSKDMRKKFLDIARLLFKKALRNEMPSEIENHVSSETEITAYLNDKEIVVSKKPWREHRAGGYSIKFVIQNAKKHGTNAIK